MKLIWISPWHRNCGIATYTRALWPAMQAVLKSAGHEAHLISLDEFSIGRSLVDEIKRLQPDVIHFQHEYGIFGGKNPPFYSFPSLVRKLKKALPSCRLVATAHTVLPLDYRFPTYGNGLETPLRAFANLFVLDKLHELWGAQTWGQLDGVITHSQLQTKIVKSAGTPRVQVIPHFVPISQLHDAVAKPSECQCSKTLFTNALLSKTKSIKSEDHIIVVFGFLTPEKGQDVAVQAVPHLAQNVKLILAGGVRRKEDERYHERVRQLVSQLGVEDRVIFTGYVEEKDIQSIYQCADLALIPFRATSGSGTLALAFSHGVPILASDLTLNLEINEREPGALAFFKSEDPRDCADQIQKLLQDKEQLEQLRAGAQHYGRKVAPERIAELHLEFYRQVIE